MNKLHKHIELNSRILHGKPVIKGTRISVELILKKLSQNISTDEILADYPKLTISDIKAALAYASELLSTDELLTISAQAK